MLFGLLIFNHLCSIAHEGLQNYKRNHRNKLLCLFSWLLESCYFYFCFNWMSFYIDHDIKLNIILYIIFPVSPINQIILGANYRTFMIKYTAFQNPFTYITLCNFFIHTSVVIMHAGLILLTWELRINSQLETKYK